MNQEQALTINRDSWNEIAAQYYGRTALPEYGPLAQSETELNLLGNITGTKILEIGCGSGHSLLYLAQRGASELWGIDIAPSQIAFASSLLENNEVTHHLFESPMEENPGIPSAYFDLVISIYALGWTVNLVKTLTLVASYLKPGGAFIFSWEHPAYRCLAYEGGQFVVKCSYHNEGSHLHPSWKGVPIVHSPRKLSTYLNYIIEAGLTLERVVESAVNARAVNEKGYLPESWYSVPRAEMIPTTVIIKARKDEARTEG